MLNRSGILTVKIDSPEAAPIQRALAAEQRVKLLGLLMKRAMNVNEIALALGITQPTASVHIQILEEAGLVGCEYLSMGKGVEKRCWATFDKLVLEPDLDWSGVSEKAEECQMPLGLYTAADVHMHCGMGGLMGPVNGMSDPSYFMSPERINAQIIWFPHGWIEYTFPCQVQREMITRVEFQAEVCSETRRFNNEWPSDITVWISRREIGAWTSPGDFGGRRGRLNPDWWPDGWTQFGLLTTWSVDSSGSYINGEKCGSTCLGDLDFGPNKPPIVRIGVSEDAKHRGGMNIFGRLFGDHPQDPLIRYIYKF